MHQISTNFLRVWQGLNLSTCIRNPNTQNVPISLSFSKGIKKTERPHFTHPRGCQVEAEPKKCTKKDTHHSKHPLFCWSIVYKTSYSSTDCDELWLTVLTLLIVPKSKKYKLRSVDLVNEWITVNKKCDLKNERDASGPRLARGYQQTNN